MANELKHGTVGTELTQAEWEAIGAHHGFDNLDSYPETYSRADLYRLYRVECFASSVRRAVRNRGRLPRDTSLLVLVARGVGECERDVREVVIGHRGAVALDLRDLNGRAVSCVRDD